MGKAESSADQPDCSELAIASQPHGDVQPHGGDVPPADWGVNDMETHMYSYQAVVISWVRYIRILQFLTVFIFCVFLFLQQLPRI